VGLDEVNPSEAGYVYGLHIFLIVYRELESYLELEMRNSWTL